MAPNDAPTETPRWLYWPKSVAEYAAMDPYERAAWHSRLAAAGFGVTVVSLTVALVALVIVLIVTVAS